MNQDRQVYARAVSGALLGLAVQALAAALLGAVAVWSGAPAALTLAGYAAGGLPLWICLWLVYQQQRLEWLEALETERLGRAPSPEARLFEQSADDLSLARRRLGQLYRWALPLTSLLAGLYLAALGAYWLPRNWSALGAPEVAAGAAAGEPLRGLAFSAAAALACFVASRYLAGMAKVPEWGLLRGGAAYLIGVALGALALSAGLACVHFELPVPLRVLALLAPAGMCVAGVEMLLHLVLDFFRPRRPGEVSRPAFDSRLLGLLTSPEGVGAALGEAINYQFGFEITRSWFWKLLERAVVPLLGFGAAVLLLLSCVVIVEPHQQALVTRFGRVAGAPLDAGPHLKWPWPVERAQLYEVARLHEIHVGSQEHLKSDTPILWANKHTLGEEGLLIVASPSMAGALPQDGAERKPGGPDKAPSASLIVANVPIQYRIRDLKDYVVRASEAEVWLRAMAEREVGAYLFRLDVNEVLGPERLASGERLRQLIQASADARSLGVEIVSVGLAGVHPHDKAADSFHAVVRAEKEKETKIDRAHQERIKTLTETAGTAELAEELESGIARLELASQHGGPKQGDGGTAELAATVDGLLQLAGGEVAVLISDARARRWNMENAERGRAARFLGELQAYQNAPRFYLARRYLEVLASGLAAARKYVLLADRQKLSIRMNLEGSAAEFDLFKKE